MVGNSVKGQLKGNLIFPLTTGSNCEQDVVNNSGNLAAGDVKTMTIKSELRRMGKAMALYAGTAYQGGGDEDSFFINNYDNGDYPAIQAAYDGVDGASYDDLPPLYCDIVYKEYMKTLKRIERFLKLNG